MQEALTEWLIKSLPELVIDQARAQNSFEGFRASYDSAHTSLAGAVDLVGPAMKVVFWHYQADQTLAPRYMATFNEQDGWKELKL